jgi:hypothetical protein
MKCPTRKSGTTYSKLLNICSGPTADYAFVLASGPGTGWGGLNPMGRVGFVATPWSDIRTDIAGTSGSYCHGPFRNSQITPDWTSHSSYKTTPSGIGFGILSWSGRDSMAWWSDGTSNQLIFGDKSIPLGKVNSCSAATGHWDCTYMTATTNTAHTLIGRSFEDSYGGNWIPIMRPNEMSVIPGVMSTYGFGSWHPGVCNFVLGDGSVHAINVTVPPSTILYPLARCDDGEFVSVP